MNDRTARMCMGMWREKRDRVRLDEKCALQVTEREREKYPTIDDINCFAKTDVTTPTQSMVWFRCVIVQALGLPK